eukprot:1187121-Prorocentrum_minimum.AAC.5
MSLQNSEDINGISDVEKAFAHYLNRGAAGLRAEIELERSAVTSEEVHRATVLQRQQLSHLAHK